MIKSDDYIEDMKKNIPKGKSKAKDTNGWIKQEPRSKKEHFQQTIKELFTVTIHQEYQECSIIIIIHSCCYVSLVLPILNGQNCDFIGNILFYYTV